MSDKDQFTFDDDDDFPETDLSSAFSDGEQEADPVTEVQEDPEPLEEPKKAKKAKAKKAKKEKKASTGGGSRTRILLLILLLVVGGAAGAYYFMDLGGTTPSVPTAKAPAKKAVSLPAKPAKAPPAAAKTESAKPVSVAVPPPPPSQKAPEKPAAKPAAQPAPGPQQAKVEKPPAQPASQPKSVAATEQPAKKPVAAPVPKPAPAPVTKQAEVQPTQTKMAETKMVKSASVPAKQAEKPISQQQAEPVAAPKQVADGAYALDAGSYLFETNRNALIEKIKKLGYEPLVTPVDATLDMTRLRIGTFSKDEVKEALAFARTIESGSYSAPAGDQYVIYAGTFLSKGNIAKLTKRFNDEGIKVYPEPVQVVRTLSRIRFGSFATKEDAKAAAALADKKGVKAVVVKSN